MPIPLKVKYPEQPRRQSLIERLIRLGLVYLPAEEANDEIVALTIRNMVLQAQIDAAAMKEGEDVII